MRPWIKMHTTTLDDTRILRLNERQQLRYFQLYLLAGRLNADGLFVENGARLDETDIAIKLRVPDPKQFSADVKTLKQAGLIRVNGKGPYIEAFAREQVDWSRKQEQERERKARQRGKDVPADVTHMSRVTKSKSRNGHAVVTPLDQDQTKKKIKKKKEIKNQPPPTPSTKRKAAPLVGGGNKSSSTSSPAKNWTDHYAPHEQEIAQIMRVAGLGKGKIETLLHRVATRISPANAKQEILAALASVYSDDDVRNKPVVAAHRLENDQVPVIFTNSNTWRIIPAEILQAAGVDVERLPKQTTHSAIRKVAENVANG